MIICNKDDLHFYKGKFYVINYSETTFNFFIESRKRKLNSSKCKCILPTYQAIRSTSKPSILLSFGNTLYDIIFV